MNEIEKSYPTLVPLPFHLDHHHLLLQVYPHLLFHHRFPGHPSSSLDPVRCLDQRYLQWSRESVPGSPTGQKKWFMLFVFILTHEQMIVFNQYCSYNIPIPKISHFKTLQNLCKIRYNNKKVRKWNDEFIMLFFKRWLWSNYRAWIALKLGRLLIFMSIFMSIFMYFCLKKSASACGKNRERAGFHWQSHNIPFKSSCSNCDPILHIIFLVYMKEHHSNF